MVPAKLAAEGERPRRGVPDHAEGAATAASKDSTASGA